MLEEGALTIDDTADTTLCVRFKPCGHVFEKDSIDDIVSEIHQLQSMVRNHGRITDGEELKQHEYDIEAQENKVSETVNSATRREIAEDDPGIKVLFRADLGNSAVTVMEADGHLYPRGGRHCCGECEAHRKHTPSTMLGTLGPIEQEFKRQFGAWPTEERLERMQQCK